jgi:hypothetical protein
MTPDQSKNLKVGTRVCFSGDPSDRGRITAVESRYVTIKWEDGHQSFTAHNRMDRLGGGKEMIGEQSSHQ